MALEPTMNDPDWDRYRVAAPPGAPVGDPTRWGAQAFTNLVPNATTYSQQVIAAATRDEYARPWSILGTLRLPTDLWLGQGLAVTLECTMGVGQVQLTQSITLFAQFPATSLGPKTGGLCYTQHFVYGGGPYLQIDEPSSNPGGGQDSSFPFAAIGAVIGQSIAIRARYTFGAIAAPLLPAVSRLVIILAPYAAGEGL